MIGITVALACFSATAGELPSAPGSLAPRLTEVGGTLHLTWLEPAGGERFAVRHARRQGDGWTTPVTLIATDELFVNWADTPALSGAADGSLLAHWPQMSGPGTYSYDVILARSVDDGATWSILGPAHTDGTQTEHGFASYAPDGNSHWLFWLDGRAMAEAGDSHEGDGHGHGHDHGHGNMALRAALISDVIGDSVVIDDMVCECCGTDAAMTSAGPVVVYRDKSTSHTRDIFIVRRVDRRWTDPVPVTPDGYEIFACPVNGPSIDARDEKVVVAWWTAPENQPAMHVAFSDDAGATFGDRITIDASWSAGRANVMLLDDDTAAVLWLDDAERAAFDQRPEGAIRLSIVSRDGGVHTREVAAAAPSRATGFPQFARDGDALLVIWTVADEGLRTVSIDLPAAPGTSESP